MRRLSRGRPYLTLPMRFVVVMPAESPLMNTSVRIRLTPLGPPNSFRARFVSFRLISGTD